MIVGQAQPRTRRSSFMDSFRNEQENLKQLAGVPVVVIQAVRLNGPDNKTLGLCEVGSVVRVRASSVDNLVRDGFVLPYDATLENLDESELPSTEEIVPSELPSTEEIVPEATVTAAAVQIDRAPVAPADDSVDENGWLILMDAGVSESQAQSLYNAGVTSKDDLRAIVADEGPEVLTQVKGIGKVAADKLIAWLGTE